MNKMTMKLNANNQYLGTCEGCGSRPEALLDGLCNECRSGVTQEDIDKKWKN